MRALTVTWRAIVSFYNELYFLIGMSLLWWATGGFFVALAALLGLGMLQINGPWWLIPVVTIPAGPATAALANVVRRVVREERVDRSYFWDGLRTYWRQALALNGLSMVILSLLLLNILFYGGQSNAILRTLTFLWLYLGLLWIGAQLYLFPLLVSLERPTVMAALRTATVTALANPLFSLVLIVVALVLTGLSIALAILILLAWPALMSLLGMHALKLFVERLQQTGKQA